MRESNLMGAAGPLRVGDAERDRCVAVIGDNYALGRLTASELDSRTELAYSAVTSADLTVLTADLPMSKPQSGLLGRRSVRWGSLPLPSRSMSRRWRRVVAPGGALLTTAWLMQTGCSSDWWHLTDSTSTGLVIASAGYACHVIGSTVRRNA